MAKKNCKNCIYLVRTANSEKIHICTNRSDTNGRLYLAKKSDTACRNFQASRVIDRPTVHQPKNSDIRFIPLTKGKVAIVDAADYEQLKQYKWYADIQTGRCYACRYADRKKIYMHRHLTNAPEGLVVDHIDGNGLNNSRSNLRICSAGQNMFNKRAGKGTSKYKGICWNKKRKNWQSAITCRGGYRFLGRFDNETDAARAYDKMAKKLFGDFAYLNFPSCPAQNRPLP